MDSDHEAYLLLLLADGNLPTGSFVASSGLESYVTHGFASASSSTAPKDRLEFVVEFVRDSLSTYARSALPFVSDAYIVTEELLGCGGDRADQDACLWRAMGDLKLLDALYQTMTLNHVARRASEQQGVALLSLYSKGFTRPTSLEQLAFRDDTPEAIARIHRDKLAALFIDKLKLTVRKGDMHGHQPVCWGVLTAALGLPLARSQFLFLFLHARGLLSASVRLNTLGPYAAQQTLLHGVRPLVQEEAIKCRDIRTDFKKLADPRYLDSDDLDGGPDGPAMTWPLGEIIAARHDLQHSRIFNS